MRRLHRRPRGTTIGSVFLLLPVCTGGAPVCHRSSTGVSTRCFHCCPNPAVVPRHGNPFLPTPTAHIPVAPIITPKRRCLSVRDIELCLSWSVVVECDSCSSSSHNKRTSSCTFHHPVNIQKKTQTKSIYSCKRNNPPSLSSDLRRHLSRITNNMLLGAIVASTGLWVIGIMVAVGYLVITA
jgi:hypothetical protein